MWIHEIFTWGAIEQGFDASKHVSNKVPHKTNSNNEK